MFNMNIWNNKRRKVRCISNSDNTWGASGTGHLLTVNELYTIDNVMPFDWYTIVYLEEFPNIKFNSVLFEEIAD